MGRDPARMGAQSRCARELHVRDARWLEAGRDRRPHRESDGDQRPNAFQVCLPALHRVCVRIYTVLPDMGST